MGLVKELTQLCQALYSPAGQAPPMGEVPEAGVNALAALVQDSARRLIAEAIDLELRHFKEALVPAGAPRRGEPVVRNGFHPERMIATGIGAVVVRPRKVRRRNGSAAGFRSALVPRYARRAQPLNVDSAALYLCAIAGGDVRHALAALVGPQAVALPLPVRRQLQEWWFEQCKAWRAGLPPELGAGPRFWSAFAGVHPKAACERRYAKAIEAELRRDGRPSPPVTVERPD
jgi:hypothetical protein